MKHMRIPTLAVFALIGSGLLSSPLQAQTTVPVTPADPGGTFASENAILDTSIPFAIGAREAQQELRGAFGWPTFQEGLVYDVYFRFDPDGYARFAPTPRLDEDVFEVICRPRTLSCMSRKQTLSMFPNSRGQLELRLEGVQPGDTFFISEGLSEIQVPDRILQPLDYNMETLLSSGGDLIVRRGDAEFTRISLKGFGAVAAYLRWIVARQDYSVLPRGWPVPNSPNVSAPTTLTETATWISPMPQPQVAPLVTQTQPAPLVVAPTSQGAAAEVAQMHSELETLRNLMLQRSAPPAPEVAAPLPMPAPSQGLAATQLQDIQATIARLEQELAMTRAQEVPQPTAPVFPPQPMVAETLPPPAPAVAPETTPDLMAQRLSYLISEIGLDPRTAVMLLQSRDDTAMQTDVSALDLPAADVVVSDIMAELGQPPMHNEMAKPAPAPLSQADYVILSDYFRSVIGEYMRSPADQ